MIDKRVCLMLLLSMVAFVHVSLRRQRVRNQRLQDQRNRQALRRERLFRDRLNPLENYDDVEVKKLFRFERPNIIHICRASLEHHTGRSLPLTTIQNSATKQVATTTQSATQKHR
jgi:hypothetical protein